MNEITRSNDAFIGFVFGAAVGAGLALLLAPTTGEETRRKVMETAKKIGTKAQDRFGSVKEDLSHRVGDVKENLSHRIDDVKEAVHAGREAYSRAATTRENRTTETGV